MFEMPTQTLKKLETEDFIEREVLESNPENYITRIYPDDLNITYEGKIEDQLRQLQSGYIDLRDMESGGQSDKYIVWLGSDHANIMINAAKFQDDPNVMGYMVGIKLFYDKNLRRIKIDKDKIGQSCERTKEQIEGILAAAEESINTSLLENEDAKKYFLLEDYGLGHIKDMNPERILLEPINSGYSGEMLIDKIEESIPSLEKKKGASIRIAFDFTSSAEEETERTRVILENIERSHPGMACSTVFTQNSLDRLKGYVVIAWDDIEN